MRWLPLASLALLILLAVAAFFVTTRTVGRRLQSSPPPPNAFAGPELVNAYTLQRCLTGPESFIESPAGQQVVPEPGADLQRFAVARVAVRGNFILGEVADLSTGASRGYFLIDTTAAKTSQSLPEAEWRALAHQALGEDPPELQPADSFQSPAAPAP
jgi:hypothetical protein